MENYFVINFFYIRVNKKIIHILYIYGHILFMRNKTYSSIQYIKTNKQASRNSPQIKIICAYWALSQKIPIE